MFILEQTLSLSLLIFSFYNLFGGAHGTTLAPILIDKDTRASGDQVY